ncbi:MAG TPA: PD-(D/E)XK nuclease family protein [Pantanalinema sp.]
MTRVLSRALPEAALLAASAHRVVTPNERAARALGVEPCSLQGLATNILSEAGFAIASPLLAVRLFRQAAASLGEAPDLAVTMAATVRELFRTGADLEALVSSAPPRAARVARLAFAYRSALRAKRLVDDAECLRVAAGRVEGTQVLLVAGYPRLGEDEVAFLDAIAGPASRVHLPNTGEALFFENALVADSLEARGWMVERPEGARPFTGRYLAPAFAPVPPRAYRYANLEAEVRGALARLKVLLNKGMRPDQVALVARDDVAYGPMVMAIAWEYGLDIGAFYAVPLAATHVGAWLRLAMEVVNGAFPYETTARLLGHRLSERLSPEVWGQVRKGHPVGLDAWVGVCPELGLLAWPERASRAGWRHLLQQMLDGFDVSERAGRSPREVLALGKLHEGLDTLAQPGDETLSRHGFEAELVDLLSLLSVPAHPDAKGVALHTPLSLYGARYRHLMVLGMAEGHFPVRVENDPVLDFHERRALEALGCRLEGAASAARREALSFWALLQVATEGLELSYAELANGEALLPSPYLADLAAALADPPSVPACSPEESRPARLRGAYCDDPVLPFALHSHRVEWGREASPEYDHFDGVPGVPVDPATRRFSASQLVTIGQCPFKWFAQRLLRLADPEEVEGELSPGLRGTLFHRALELAVEGALPLLAPRAHVLSRLDEAFARAEVELQVQAVSAWTAQRDFHLKTLRAAVEAPGFVADGAAIVQVEGRFTGRAFGLNFIGYVDRIDRTDDGLVFVDYKTSSSPPKGAKDDEGKPKVDVQLPLYMEVAAPALFPGEPVAGAHYYSLTKGEVLKKAVPSPGDLERLTGKVKAHLEAGSYPVAPDVDEASCLYCDLALVCRSGPRLARKQMGGEENTNA